MLDPLPNTAYCAADPNPKSAYLNRPTGQWIEENVRKSAAITVHNHWKFELYVSTSKVFSGRSKNLKRILLKTQFDRKR